MAANINESENEVKRVFTAASMLLTVDEHSMQLDRAINKCRIEYEIFIDVIINCSVI
jgi:hypothetical protein